MDYYERRKQAIASIDKMFATGRTTEEIIKYIEEFYGYAPKIIKERIELLKSFQ